MVRAVSMKIHWMQHLLGHPLLVRGFDLQTYSFNPWFDPWKTKQRHAQNGVNTIKVPNLDVQYVAKQFCILKY